MGRAAAGFTLVETLVALAIFALIGAASYQVLASVIDADTRTSARNLELRRLNRALWQMQRDLEQLVPRSVRTAAGATEPELKVDAAAGLPLVFTRAGRGNPLGLARSSLQRIGYSVGPHPDHESRDTPHYGDERPYLLRHVWRALDGGEDEPLVQVLLADVESVVVTVLDGRGEWQQWPPPSGGQAVAAQPRAVRVEFDHARWGELSRLYKVL